MMKMNTFVSEILIASVLIILLFAFLSPYDLLMPMSLDKMLILALAVFFIAFSTLVWKESARDERDDLHRLQAGRISFLVGSTILAIGILVQSTSHNIDPWLIYALVGMIFSKIASRIHSNLRK